MLTANVIMVNIAVSILQKFKVLVFKHLEKYYHLNLIVYY